MSVILLSIFLFPVSLRARGERDEVFRCPHFSQDTSVLMNVTGVWKRQVLFALGFNLPLPVKIC